MLGRSAIFLGGKGGGGEALSEVSLWAWGRFLTVLPSVLCEYKVTIDATHRRIMPL